MKFKIVNGIICDPSQKINYKRQDIYVKDSVDENNTQIITAKSGKIIERGSEKYLNLNFGQILDMTKNDYNTTKVIKFNNTKYKIDPLKLFAIGPFKKKTVIIKNLKKEIAIIHVTTEKK